MTIKLTGNTLTLQDINAVAYEQVQVIIHPDSKQKILRCREYVDKIIREGKVVYGLTTGFGKFANITIPPEQIDELQENLIKSHATGVGKSLSIPEIRAVMLLRINVLANGHSGIRFETVQLLVDMLNSGVHPSIPEKGSVGASGDLAPLSHLALVMLGLGTAEFQGQMLPGDKALKAAGLNPIKLKAKEGLALNNGTQVMTAITALTYLRAERLAKVADICAAMSLDALLGTIDAFDPLIHKLRPYKGQQQVAENIRILLEGSRIRESHRSCTNVQDPYSLRCVPQVHGAVRESLDYVRKTLEVEINSTTDNPLIFPDEDKVLSGGNFHGEPVALAADSLSIAVAELGNIAERRTEQIMNPALNRDLNAFLANRPGLDSGFMIAHVTATALVSENKTLSHPASVDSIPTSANQEDHVSMGTIGARKARAIVDNVSSILGIELMVATQAVELRTMKSSDMMEKVKHIVRKEISSLEKDRILDKDIEAATKIVDSNTLLKEIKLL
jgi:histidine ammonia-lyase